MNSGPSAAISYPPVGNRESNSASVNSELKLVKSVTAHSFQQVEQATEELNHTLAELTARLRYVCDQMKTNDMSMTQAALVVQAIDRSLEELLQNANDIEGGLSSQSRTFKHLLAPVDQLLSRQSPVVFEHGCMSSL